MNKKLKCWTNFLDVLFESGSHYAHMPYPFKSDSLCHIHNVIKWCEQWEVAVLLGKEGKKLSQSYWPDIKERMYNIG